MDLASALENSRFILIISMRDDFYSVFNTKAGLLAESENIKIQNIPGSINRHELFAIIKEPAAAVGLVIEEGLSELNSHRSRKPGRCTQFCIAFIGVVLTQLWEGRSDGILTHEAYQAVGGVTGSLARWADDAYSILQKLIRYLLKVY